MLNLDTHIILFFLTETLTVQERRIMANQELSISPIVFWEIGKLAQIGRISVTLEDPQLLAFLQKVTLHPITQAVALAASALDFRSDPADELIAGTSVAHGIPLLTRDRKLLASKVVPLATVNPLGQSI